ncbi:MAG: ankyrin repeat domain-containing protein [Verrucomicrobiota bacterium]
MASVGLLLCFSLTSCGKRDEGVTDMMRAAKEGDLAAIERLVSSGSDVNEKSAYSWTPLMFAAREGHTEVVRALLDAGAKVDHVSGKVPAGSFATRGGLYPTSAIAEALENDHEEVANLLLESAASIHAVDMVAAAESENGEWIRKLKDAGGDPAATTYLSYQGSPLCAASSAGNFETVKWLVNEQGVDVNQQIKGTDPLEQAVRNDHVEIVQFLLEKGANANSTYEDSTMPTILLVAMKKPQADSWLDRNLKVIELLIDHDADPRLEPDYSVFGLGVIGEKRNAIAVAQASVEEYREYYDGETDPEWRAKKKKRLEHREAIVELLTQPSSKS